jgi:hypothetical protein
MAFINNQQIIKFNALLRNLGLEDDDKRGIIASFTNGRTSKTKEMLYVEAKAMLQHLSALAPYVQSEESAAARVREKENKMRKKVIAIAYQLGWTTPQGKCDYARLDRFIAARPVTPGATSLNQYTAADLPKLINQFEELLKKYLNAYDSRR